MRGNTSKNYSGGQKQHIKIRYLIISGLLTIIGALHGTIASAESCPDVRIVFARGSGGEQDTSADYLEFRDTIEQKLKTTSLKYEFTDLDYPAVGVGFDSLERITTTLGAFVSGGESYSFGDSVKVGVSSMERIAKDERCKNVKYVLGGYSQGAMVVLKSLQFFKPEQIIYAATFGDPKIYLPEGAGVMPAACREENLSDYRMYVPDCYAHKGILGAFIPYEPDEFAGKLGTWCNKMDALCSSHLNINDHVNYVSDGLYEDASRVIFDKIARTFSLENNYSSPHDTVILIDSTGSMRSMINNYKDEALRLARETLEAGGRVALYDYRDLKDPYQPVEHCNFNTCTLEVFQKELDNINPDGGGDDPESLLSASLLTMNSLTWKKGATKSLVVLTDANYLSPDRDGTSLDEVVALSKSIDPVNFYIITEPGFEDYYNELASRTGGKVVTNFNELSLLTDYILGRYDSLPRVEISEPKLKPTLSIISQEKNGDKISVSFTTDGDRVLVVLNDTILGTTKENAITIQDLDFTKQNNLALIPLSDDIKGEGVEVVLRDYTEHLDEDDKFNNDSFSDNDLWMRDDILTSDTLVLPKTPNTGKR